MSNKKSKPTLNQQLMFAVVANDAASAAALVESGADANARDSRPLAHEYAEESARDTAFLHALRLGHLACAEILLPRADLSLAGFKGDSAAILAVRSKDMSWIAKIDASWAPELPNVNGRDALRSAVEMDLSEAALHLSPLCFAGACHAGSSSALARAIELGSAQTLAAILPQFSTRASPEDFFAALNDCALHGRLDAAKFLASSGARLSGDLWPAMFTGFAGQSVSFINWALLAIGPRSTCAQGRDALACAIESKNSLAIRRVIHASSPAPQESLAALAGKLEDLCQSNSDSVYNTAQARAWLCQLNLQWDLPQSEAANPRLLMRL